MSNSLSFSPASGPVDTPQARQLTNGRADRNGLYLDDVSNHLEIHNTNILPASGDSHTARCTSSMERPAASIWRRSVLVQFPFLIVSIVAGRRRSRVSQDFSLLNPRSSLDQGTVKIRIIEPRSPGDGLAASLHRRWNTENVTATRRWAMHQDANQILVASDRYT